LRQRIGEFNATIPLIISNHPDLKNPIEDLGIEFACCPLENDNQKNQEKCMLGKLKEKGIDLIVLARFMRILSNDFVKHYPNKIINIHHSFLPAFAGAKPYHQAHEKGVKIIGATAHYVTAELDNGPIIEQDTIRISHRDSVEDIIRKGRDLEKIVLARAVNLHLNNRVLSYANKTVVFD
jgi:formyltetrahydrofolate deformylase